MPGTHDRHTEAGAGEPDGLGPDHPAYRIGMVTKELDLGQYTLKHYERAGLIEPSTSEAGFRFYTRREFGEIIAIRTLRRLGFSVEEVGEVLALDAPGTLDALEEKYRENERRIAELQESNRLLHRRISSLRNNVGRPRVGAFDPAAAGLLFVTHFKGDELAGGSALVDAAVWKDLYERSLLALRVERDAVDAEGLTGCWWGLVPLGELPPGVEDGASEARGGCVVRVPVGPAVLASVEAAGGNRAFEDVRAAVRSLLDASGHTLAGDVYAVADDVRLCGSERSMVLTLRIPVAADGAAC